MSVNLKTKIVQYEKQRKNILKINLKERSLSDPLSKIKRPSMCHWNPRGEEKGNIF